MTNDRPILPPRAVSTLSSPSGGRLAVAIQTSATAPKRWDGITALLMGDSGIGKTTIARSATSPYFVMFRGGGEHKPMPLYDTDIEWSEIYTKDEWDMLLTNLEIYGLPAGRKTLVLDQLPSLYNLHSEDILVNTSRKRDNAETFAQSDFGQARNRFLRMMMQLSRVKCADKTPINLLLLSIGEPDVDQQTQDRTYLPMLPGKLAREMPGQVSFVFHMENERRVLPSKQSINVRVIHTQSRPGYFAKDSTGLLPPKIDIPSPDFPFWDEVVAYLKGDKKR
jgi:AAA domain